MIGQGLRVLRIPNRRILNETEKVLLEIAECLPLLWKGVGDEELDATR